MKITSSIYVSSFKRIQDIAKPHFPAVAFIGRSNVGKSSMINHLLNRKNLVKTSSTPGKTQLINLFLINQSVYFVDLPGYGYANVPVVVKREWRKMIYDFLKKYHNLKIVLQLTDIRHQPNKHDKEFQDFLKHHQIPNLVIANKVDKLKKNQIRSSINEIQKTLALDNPPVVHSALKKIGNEEIWKRIDNHLYSLESAAEKSD